MSTIPSIETFIPAAIMILLLAGLYFFSEIIVQDLFSIFHVLLRKPARACLVLAILFLPGTFIHEAAHYVAAKILLLNVVGFSVWPEWKHNSIQLGSVTYIRRDPVRGILVGVAPAILGVVMLNYIISSFTIPRSDMLLTNGVLFLIFSISSTMFSSKQDLADLKRLLPYIICLIVIMYIVKFNPSNAVRPAQTLLVQSNPYLKGANIALSIALLVQTCVFCILKLIRLVVR